VIPFLIVTSIINILLGYALAVYLGRASAQSEPNHAPTADDAADSASDFAAAGMTADSRSFSWPTESIVAGSTSSFGPLGQAQPAPAEAPTMLHTPATEAHESVQARTAEMEQELLAGIEEFRNQLAQLKGQASVTAEPSMVGAR
jgi:hypothetical protein